MDTEEISLKAGDVCVDCQQQGLVKHLRYFKLNLNGDTLLKCESNKCMYPYNDQMSSSDEEDVQNLTESNSLKFIDDFIQQYSKETEVQNSNYALTINTNITEQAATFDISFLDSISGIESENICKNEIFDNKSNVEIIGNQYLTLPILNSLECEIPSAVLEKDSNLCKTEFSMESPVFMDNKTNVKIMENQYVALPNLNALECEKTATVIEPQIDNQILTFIDESVSDCKPKIDIQSIETIKMESPFYNILPSSSTTITTATDISTTPASKYLQITNNNCKSSTISEVENLSSISNLNETKISPNSLKNTSPLEIAVTTIKSPAKSLDSDIPKANIMKGSDFLKKLALVEEKIAKHNPKLKGARSKKKTANKVVIKTEEKPSPAFSGDSDYSLDMLSKMLMANKMKRN